MLNIYIVSLEQDLHKRNKISGILNSYGLKYQFVDAIYGKKLSEEEREFYINKSTGKILDRCFMPTPGEIGCTLSHIKAYKQIVNNGDEWACILEDDVILDQRFQKFIKEFDCNNINMDSHSIYLLGGQEGLFSHEIVKSIQNFHEIGSQKLYKTIRSEAIIYRTCCYVLNAQLAKRMLEFYQINFILADDWNYLLKNKFINRIYLGDFVEHPIDLSNSLIESERVNASGNVRADQKISNLLSKLKKPLKKIRILFFKIYVIYLEKKD